MGLFIVIFIAAAFCVKAWCVGDRNGKWEGRRVKYHYAYDGDTYTFHGGLKVRVRNIDTPEMDAVSPFQRDVALHARNYARKMLREAGEIRLEDVKGRDKYGRLLARVVVDGKDVGSYLLRKGLARPWIERGKKY